MSEIKIEDGLKTYNIVNKEGKLFGQVSFNPSDTGFLRRYEEAIREIDKKIGENANEKNEEQDGIKALLEFEDFIREKFDYIFNSNISEIFFSIMGACSPLETGDLFYANVLNAIGNIIHAETGTRVKKVNSKIQKHTRKYHK